MCLANYLCTSLTRAFVFSVSLSVSLCLSLSLSFSFSNLLCRAFPLPRLFCSPFPFIVCDVSVPACYSMNTPFMRFTHTISFFTRMAPPNLLRRGQKKAYLKSMAFKKGNSLDCIKAKRLIGPSQGLGFWSKKGTQSGEIKEIHESKLFPSREAGLTS